MEEDKDILERAAEVLRNEKIPPVPPQELVDETVARLAEISRQSDTIQLESRIRIRKRLKAVKKLNKVAAAAVLLIVTGYVVGRLSASRPPDIKQLQATLTPAIRRELLNEMNQHLQVSYDRLIDELDRQYRQDLSRVAMQILAASNMVTNERLAELIESINEAQTHQRQWVTAALDRVESNHLQDSALLSNALATVAQRTEEELERTKQDVVQLLSYAQPTGDTPNQFRE